MYDDPDNTFVAGFIGSPRMNFLRAHSVGGGRFAVGGMEVAVPLATSVAAGTEVQFGIRPEHFEAVDGVEIPVTADVVEQLGSTSYLYGTIATGEPIVAQRSQGRRRPGDRVALRFNPMDARLFDRDGTRIR